MRRLFLLAAFLLSCAFRANAQLQIPSFASDPVTCNPARGLMYYNTTLGLLKSCTGINLWGPINSSGGAITPLAFGAAWDVKYVYDATYTSGSATITCPNNDCNFTSADQNKIVIGFEGPWGVQFYNSPAYANLITNETTVLPTITAINGPQSITVSAVATQNCAATAANTNICTLAWGTQDDAAAINAAMAAAWNTPGKCLALQLPTGAAFFGSGIVNDTFALMASACGGQPGTTGGMDTTQAGPQVLGFGMNATQLIPLPTFNLTTQCTKGASGQGCNFTTPNLEAHDFGVNGLANAGSGTQAASLVELDGSTGGASCTGSTGFNLDLANWEANVTNTIGFDVGRAACGSPAYWNNISELFGATNCQVQSNQQLTFNFNACLGAITNNVLFNVGGSATLYSNGGYYITKYAVNANEPVVVNFGLGGIFNSTADYINVAQSIGAFNVIRVPTSSSNGTLNLSKDYLILQNSTGASQAIGAFSTIGSTTHMDHTTVTATGVNNKTMALLSNNIFYNDGGNVFQDGGSNSTFVSNQYIGNPGNSLKGTCTGTATSASTLGLYGSGPNVTVTTCTSATIGAGIAITGPTRTLQHLNVTATHAGVNASSGVVTVLRNGVSTTITCTIGTGTQCDDFTHDIAVSDGDLISIQFTTQAAEVLAGVIATVEWN